jgi:hypothetical protein
MHLVGVIVLFILALLYFRSGYEEQIASLNDQILMQEFEFENTVPKPKYAIVTMETRSVSYWPQSLENKYSYARKHGYRLYQCC